MTSTMANEAWATGWASVTDPDLGYVPMTEATHAARAAATSLDAPLTWVAETAETAARRVTLHRARLRLYHQQADLVVAAMAGLINRVDLDHLITSMMLAGIDKQARRDQAYTTLINTIAPIRPSVDAANAAAWTAVTARGVAEAAASTRPGPPSPTVVAAGIAGAALSVSATDAQLNGADWTDRELSRQAWDLSAGNLVDPDDGQQTHDNVKASLTGLAGVHASSQDLMHGALAAGFIGAIAVVTTTPSIWWTTQEDDLVCVICDGNEANSPYLPGDVPALPAHPTCRCGLERG